MTTWNFILLKKKSVVGCHKYSAYNVAIYVLYIKKVNFDGIRCVGFFYNFFNVKYKHPNNNVRCWMTGLKRHRVGLPRYTKGRPSLASARHHISIQEHNHDNVYDEITSESMYKIYILVTLVSSSRRRQTCRVVCDCWRADILKRRSISTQLKAKI